MPLADSGLTGDALPSGLASLAGAKIVLGVTGSIAAYKAAELVRALGRAGATVQPVMTPAATRFIPALTLSVLAGRETLVDLFPDGDRGGEGAAASTWTKHVELGLWADAVVVAPATAQTMATLAHGFCDSMLAAVVLSARCPVLVAPAMDHDMW
ncbi:MAG TPA: flavoprotein, partial [Rubricoccaceae bacterium]